jgi:hypothetical protein
VESIPYSFLHFCSCLNGCQSSPPPFPYAPAACFATTKEWGGTLYSDLSALFLCVTKERERGKTAAAEHSIVPMLYERKRCVQRSEREKKDKTLAISIPLTIFLLQKKREITTMATMANHHKETLK